MRDAMNGAVAVVQFSRSPRLRPGQPMRGGCRWSSFAPLVFLVSILGSRVAAGQSGVTNGVIELRPGDPRITCDVTVPHVSRWSMTRIVPGALPVDLGVWLDRQEVVSIDGRTLRRFQSDVIGTTGRPRRDVVFWDQNTMETVSAELGNYNNSGGWAYFVYDHEHVSQVYRRDPFAEAFSESRTLDTRVFEPGHGLVFAKILDLRPPNQVRYPYHQRATDEVIWVTLQAVRDEVLETPKFGPIQTLLIESSRGWRYWTVSDPPYVYRLDIPTGDGTIDRWDLLEYVVENNKRDESSPAIVPTCYNQ